MTNERARQMAYIAGLALASAMASGCSSSGTIVRDRPVEVRVPVPQPCAGPRPARIIPLKDQLTFEDWIARDVRQKAATIGKQALDRQTYGEQLDAATAACPAVTGGD
ncbi:hypothetical protein [Allopontixanthobacter sp.]|uniref:hypothetical protein n=1 Tax=Allopontixanthobacter sp. TaxID=2906452 RepID=UPI002AB81ACA|nr:hypothetical protein [Allopontixanthobacter sp.]MDZ4307544.1 hypothetical protein [Allopontixanthobacter sp.]